jgi:ElaB/YqjD/DUF883 family membrane-anchored ribosome-binding protein
MAVDTSHSSGKRPNSLDDAVNVLDQAISTQQAPGPAIGEAVRNVGESLKGVGGSMREYSSHAYEQVTEVANEGLLRGRELGRKVDQQVRENPWPVIGGVAIGTFLLGFMMGRRQAVAVIEVD